MADLKISQLTAITVLTPATDVLPVVDSGGVTKKITTNQILGSGGTATLASATITGAATVGTTLGVTGVSTFAAGTALLPALTTTGDTNTGIYYPAADTFAVTTGGTERYRVDATGLGIGVSPTEALTVRSSAAGAMGRFHSTNVNGPYVIFQNSTGNFGDIGSELAITGGGSAGNLTLNSRSTSNLCFSVNDSVKMRIDSSGNVGIGVTPAGTGGCLQLKSGITFPATQVASSDANTLDDYKEGSWTPTLNSGTFSSASCRYTKIGNMVTIFFDVTVGTGGGDRITNLPYAAASTSTVANGIYTNNQTYAAGTTAPVVVVGGSSSTLFFRTVGTGVAFSAMTLTAAANLTGSISYFV